MNRLGCALCVLGMSCQTAGEGNIDQSDPSAQRSFQVSTSAAKTSPRTAGSAKQGSEAARGRLPLARMFRGI